MAATTIQLGRPGATLAIGRAVREARTLVGWTQRELAGRAGTSQASVSRLESGVATVLDLATVESILAAFGIRAELSLHEGRNLLDRERQRDVVHARVNGYVARRLERGGWLTATEVGVGDGAPRGWIDLLTFRPSDRSLLLEETKTEIPDMGGLQRGVAFYEREAREAARRLGWHPARQAVLVVVLDSATIARRLADNRDLVTRAFPARIGDVAAWLDDPHRPPPLGWALGTCDPGSRARTWLRPTMLGSRRRPPVYVDYAEAAARLTHP